MIIIYTIVILIIAISLALFANWMFEEWSDSRICQIVGIIAIGIAIFCGIMGLIFCGVSIDWIYTKINLAAVQESTIQRGEILTSLLNFYQEELAANDITASEVYKTIYEDIRNYNYEVMKCNRWRDCWWVEGVLYDPSFLTATLIPIN